MALANRSTPATRTGAASGRASRGKFQPPLTVSHAELLQSGSDFGFRDSLYLMVLALDRLLICRDAFGRSAGLTGSQFAVLFGTAYRQGEAGVTIRDLADHVHLASTHVTTEVGRLIRKGLLTKKVNLADKRSVLVSLSRKGEQAVVALAPFMRDVNDLLFRDIKRADMDQLRQFLTRFLLNSEYALAELRRRDRKRLLDAHPRR
jgi:MarR family transcriptional regulator, organic hydroperoxide resistance regulator